jgi:hypothetical protein
LSGNPDQRRPIEGVSPVVLLLAATGQRDPDWQRGLNLSREGRNDLTDRPPAIYILVPLLAYVPFGPPRLRL